MTAHTPGPWLLWQNDKGAFVINMADGVSVICSRNDFDHKAAESIANGRLIAEAPKLLAALRLLDEFAWTSMQADCIESLNEANRRLAIARAAIANAMGRAP